MVSRFGSAGGPLTSNNYSSPNNGSTCTLAMQESAFKVLAGNAPNVVPAMSIGSSISIAGGGTQFLDLFVIQLPS